MLSEAGSALEGALQLRKSGHRSVVVSIDGDSYRMRAHRARAEILRKGVNASAER